MELNELIFRFFLFVMTVFTLTSAVLYSEIVSDLRTCWIDYFKSAKNRQVQKLQFLGICSLCLSFHVANIIQWLYLPLIGVEWYLAFSLSACGITWCITSWVSNQMWQKAYYEKKFNRE